MVFHSITMSVASLISLFILQKDVQPKFYPFLVFFLLSSPYFFFFSFPSIPSLLPSLSLQLSPSPSLIYCWEIEIERCLGICINEVNCGMPKQGVRILLHYNIQLSNLMGPRHKVFHALTLVRSFMVFFL